MPLNTPTATLPTDAELARVRDPRAFANRNDRAVFARELIGRCLAANDAMLAAIPDGQAHKASEARAFNSAYQLVHELEGIYDDNTSTPVSLPSIEQQLRGVVAPAAGGRVLPYAKGCPLARNQTYEGYVKALGLVDPEDEAADFGKFVNGIARGDWSGAGLEVKNMSEGTGPAGGFMVPTILSAQLIDLARNKTRVLEAGATVVPMENQKVDIAKWTGDPVSAWHSENAAIAASDPTLGKVTLTAQSWACNVEVSWELIEDAAVGGLQDELMNVFAEQLALKLDLAGLYGSGVAPEPLGAKNSTAVTKTPLGANGAALTSYDPLIDAVGRLQDANEEPTGIIYAPRTDRALAKLKEATTNAYLAPPPFLDPYPRYLTRQVPTNLVVGTSGATTSDVFTADWRQLLVGIRTQLEIKVLKERYADFGQTGFVAWFRGDIQVARGAAFDVTTGVL